MFSARAGTYPVFSWWRSTASRRIAASIAAGVVSEAFQTASDRAPLIAARLEDASGVRRALAARLVLRERRLAARGPRLEDRVADLPLRLDLVVAGEERRVAAHGVHDQALV